MKAVASNPTPDQAPASVDAAAAQLCGDARSVRGVRMGAWAGDLAPLLGRPGCVRRVSG